jgi:hypothetical protein
MKIETAEFKLPAYWASYLINGDASGLQDGEQSTIDAWIKHEGNPHFVDCGEQYFSHTNEATNLGGDVCDFVAHYHIEEAKPDMTPTGPWSTQDDYI